MYPRKKSYPAKNKLSATNKVSGKKSVICKNPRRNSTTNCYQRGISYPAKNKPTAKVMLSLKVMQYVIICQYLISYTLLAPSTIKPKPRIIIRRCHPSNAVQSGGRQTNKSSVTSLIRRRSTRRSLTLQPSTRLGNATGLSVPKRKSSVSEWKIGQALKAAAEAQKKKAKGESF